MARRSLDRVRPRPTRAYYYIADDLVSYYALDRFGAGVAYQNVSPLSCRLKRIHVVLT